MTRRSSGELRDDLQRWVTAGLLGREEAEAIAVNEAAAEGPPGGGSVLARTAGLVLDPFTDIDEDSIALVIGLAMAVPAFILWRLHGAVLQQMALLGSLVVTVLGVFMILPGEPSGPAMALAAWALGMVWVLAGWRRVITPQTATMGA